MLCSPASDFFPSGILRRLWGAWGEANLLLLVRATASASAAGRGSSFEKEQNVDRALILLMFLTKMV